MNRKPRTKTNLRNFREDMLRASKIQLENRVIYVHPKTKFVFERDSHIAYGKLNEDGTQVVKLNEENIAWLEKMGMKYEKKVYWNARKLKEKDSPSSSPNDNLAYVQDLKTGRTFLISRWRIKHPTYYYTSEDEIYWG